MVKNVINFVHELLERTVDEYDIVVDATCGNGHDTLFLAEIADYVYAFDIQDQAIEKTKKQLKRNQMDNVKIIKDSHEHILKYVKQKVKAVTFNCGYLPGSDKQIITKAESTLKALADSLTILKEGGIVTLILYIGHEGGNVEANKVEEFAKSLDKNDYSVLKYDFINRNLSPYVIVIQKQ